MTVTAPPRTPRPSDPMDREDVEALVEALIEEARQHARRRRRRNGAVGVLLALVAVTLFAVFERTAESQTSSPALAARPSLLGGFNSKIAFITGSANQRGWALWVMNADGNGAKRLAGAASNSFNPAWSPDGQEITFQSQRDGNFEVYVMNADGTAPRNLTRNPANQDGSPAWSPDGRKVAFLRWDGGSSGDIYVMSADGGGLRRLARNATGEPGTQELPWFTGFHCSVSPDTIFRRCRCVIEVGCGLTASTPNERRDDDRRSEPGFRRPSQNLDLAPGVDGVRAGQIRRCDAAFSPRRLRARPGLR